MVVETLRCMAENRVQAAPQDHEKATYTRLLTKEDGRIEWERDAEYLTRLVRAMNPWPGAFSEISGESVKVWDAVAMEGTEKAGYVRAFGRKGYWWEPVMVSFC